MDLLLLLTAFLASLTGIGQADRLVRQVEGVAVVHAADTVAAAVKPAQHVAPAIAAPAFRPQRVGTALADMSAGVSLRLPFERRLE